MSSLQEWLSPGESTETTVQFDAFLGFVNSQQLGSKTTAYPDLVLLSLLKTRLGVEQSVQQMCASLMLEAKSMHPLGDLGPETGTAAAAAVKKRNAAFLDTALAALERRLVAATPRPPCSPFC